MVQMIFFHLLYYTYLCNVAKKFPAYLLLAIPVIENIMKKKSSAIVKRQIFRGREAYYLYMH